MLLKNWSWRHLDWSCATPDFALISRTPAHLGAERHSSSAWATQVLLLFLVDNLLLLRDLFFDLAFLPYIIFFAPQFLLFLLPFLGSHLLLQFLSIRHLLVIFVGGVLLIQSLVQVCDLVSQWLIGLSRRRGVALRLILKSLLVSLNSLLSWVWWKLVFRCCLGWSSSSLVHTLILGSLLRFLPSVSLPVLPKWIVPLHAGKLDAFTSLPLQSFTPAL